MVILSTRKFVQEYLKVIVYVTKDGKEHEK